ncbi:kinase-like domain-containing protein [Xylaria sp. CBS 124048]|nr:kinase-like domain-containing protein [Xylaria sp. CBS 124048]
MADCEPIAQIFCRYVETPPPGPYRPGTGFVDCQAQQQKHFAMKCHASLDIPLYPHQVVRVGRKLDLNDIAILHSYVSRSHFVIYSVEYEEGTQPLVYVRDYNSLSGTYVNNEFTGRMKLPSSSGHILSQGEIIRIGPYWEFHIYLLGAPPPDPLMGKLRLSEIDLFRDRFIITERILGKGGLAHVHLAIEVDTRRQVACKIHRLDRFQQLRRAASTIRRILDETNILSRLSHPHVLKFEAAFRSSTSLYTFTELATGGDLFSMRLACPDALPEADTKLIVRQIVEAVTYLHRQGVTHRDLKPENVFFATGPAPLARVIVGDLGFAKVNKSTRMASKVGTERFMAPEISRGQPYGTEVDIWSIGMISLFLIMIDWDEVGHFETFDQAAIDRDLTDIFGGSTGICEALSDDFKNFVRACLVLEPCKRMAAKAAKGHNWFRSSESELESQIKELVKEWKPARVVHNSVQDLDLLKGTDTEQVTTGKPFSKRKAMDDKPDLESSQSSHYFTKGDSTIHEKPRSAPAPPVLKLSKVS